MSALVSCTHRWTAKERNDFQIKCSQTDTVSGLSFSLTGFRFDEIDTIQIKELTNNQINDTFSVFIQKGTQDQAGNKYFGHIDRMIHLKNSYQFIIKGQVLHTLSDMQMIMWAQWTMASEGYGCVMGNYSIDGVIYKHNDCPNFVKTLY